MYPKEKVQVSWFFAANCYLSNHPRILEWKGCILLQCQVVCTGDTVHLNWVKINGRNNKNYLQYQMWKHLFIYKREI